MTLTGRLIAKEPTIVPSQLRVDGRRPCRLEGAITVDYWQKVQDLGIGHRVKDAQRALMQAGTAATPALRRGLQHPNRDVRVGCEIILDHYLDEAAVPELIANLGHQ